MSEKQSLSDRKNAVLNRLAGTDKLIEGTPDDLSNVNRLALQKKRLRLGDIAGRITLATAIALAVSPTARETAGNIFHAVKNMGQGVEHSYDKHNTNTDLPANPTQTTVEVHTDSGTVPTATVIMPPVSLP